MTEFVLNCGPDGKYDATTGTYHGHGNGIWTFRVGDVVENIHTGQRDTITALYPKQAGALGSPCIVQVGERRRCCVLVIKPTNPERMSFGYIVQTTMQFQGRPVGSCARFPTKAEADAEVSRLRSVGYPGTIVVQTA